MFSMTDPSPHQRGGPISQARTCLGEKIKSWSKISTRPETKNDCVGEGQQLVNLV
jgi:hypothetical protein